MESYSSDFDLLPGFKLFQLGQKEKKLDIVKTILRPEEHRSRRAPKALPAQDPPPMYYTQQLEKR